MKAIRERQKAIRSQNNGSASARRLHELLQELEQYRARVADQDRTIADMRRELQEASNRYSDLYHLSPVGFLTLNRVGCITQLNDRAAAILMRKASWLVGRPFMFFVAKPDIPRCISFLTSSLQDSNLHTIDIDLNLKNQRVPVQVSVRSSFSDATPIQRMTLLDLTNVKLVEKQLHTTLEHWSALVQNAPDVIMTIDRSGKIAFVNRPVWGCSVEELAGTRITDYVARKEWPKIEQCLEKTFGHGQRTMCEIKDINGSANAWFSFTFGPARSDGSPLTGTTVNTTTTAIIREISTQKRNERGLRRSREQSREFAARLEAVREEERTHLAHEIHDEFGQALTVLKLDLSWLRSKMPVERKEERKKLKELMDYVDVTIDRVRGIAASLRPPVLDDLGLMPAIEWQLSEYQKRTGIQCQFESTIEKLEITPEVAAAMFRVVQEALTNVVRHASASNVRVKLDSDGDMLNISIIDNGKGASKQQINNIHSLGIAGMKERVSRLGGHFNIFSRPSEGTRIDIKVPIGHD
jgi:PAS domain S-box-containing protein